MAYRTAALVLCLALTAQGCGDDGTAPEGGGPSGGADAGAPAGGGGDGGGSTCSPGDIVACYSGPADTRDVGLCVAGQQACLPSGEGFGPCEGEIVPSVETCVTAGDEDCDGLVNEDGEDCGCEPGETQECYSAAPSTEGVGPCVAGTQTCNADGEGWGPCDGEVVPSTETCNTPEDDDCDGDTNESGAGCVCTPNATLACYTGPDDTRNVGACDDGGALCNDQGTALGECTGDVTPADEPCGSPTDLDCDGESEEISGCTCTTGETIACYEGPANTQNVGTCTAGLRSCSGGTGFGECAGDVVPTTESCATAGDEDCDGTANEGCPCAPNAVGSCYGGPAGTEGVGTCKAGTRTCNAGGTAWGQCMGDVRPVAELCGNGADDDCDSTVDEKEWRDSAVDNNEPGTHLALVVDASGGVHALYHDTFFDDLDYAYKAPGATTFTRTTVANEPAGYPRLVVDASGGVHVLYHDAFFDRLVYAYKTAAGATFTTTTVDSHPPGPASQLVVDAAGGVHALYQDTFFDHLDYSYKPAGGAFTETTVDVHAPGPFPAMVVDAAGGVHALYQDTFFGDVDYAYKPAGGTFTETTLDVHDPGEFVQLAVDAQGGVHALYHDAFFDDLDYAYKPAAGTFTETTVETNAPGARPKLVVDAARGVHVLYEDTFFDDLEYAYKPNGGAFTRVVIESNPTGADAKLIVDAAGGVHALYHDTFFDDLEYAYKPSGGAFTRERVDNNLPGDDPQLFVDGLGGLHALYHDTFFDDLDYASRCP